MLPTCASTPLGRAMITLLGLLATVSRAELPPAPTPFRLFVGLDVAVTPEQGVVPLIGIDRNRLVLGDKAHSRVYPVDAGAFRILHAIKVSRAQATVENLKASRSFTPDNDPITQGMILQNEMALNAQVKQASAELKYFDAEATRATNYHYTAANSAALARGERAPYDGMGTIESVDAASQQDTSTLVSAHETFAQETRSTLGGDLRARAESRSKFDVMDLSFVVSSPQSIQDAYAVVMVTTMEEGEKKSYPFYEPIGELDAKPRRISLRRAGFKPGFEIVDLSVHLYTRGQELVTNHSAKETPLTTDQTREYLLLSHLSENPHATLPAQPVWSLAPYPLLAATAAATYDQTVAVNIDTDGRIISIHDSLTAARQFASEIVDVDAVRSRDLSAGDRKTFAPAETASASTIGTDQTQHVPPPIVAALQDMFFLPALTDGKPTVSTIEINLASFFL